MSPIWHSILPEYRNEFGYIVSIKKNGYGGVQRALENKRPWIFDNGVFTGAYSYTKWEDTLIRLRRYRSTCLGVMAPDIVGNWEKTLENFYTHEENIRLLGYPVALVTQDGLPISEIPWRVIDTIFIGGTDDHKMKESWIIINEALNRKKWVHVGRVNSQKRINLFWMANSWDGTTLAISPEAKKQHQLIRAARTAQAKKETIKLL